MNRTTQGTLTLAAICFSIACLAVAWGSLVRVTPAGLYTVYRDNLVTGESSFCGVRQDGQTVCVEVAGH